MESFFSYSYVSESEQLIVNPLNLSPARSFEPRYQRARRDLASVRYIMEDVLIPSVIIELLIERQLAFEGNLVNPVKTYCNLIQNICFLIA